MPRLYFIFFLILLFTKLGCGEAYDGLDVPKVTQTEMKLCQNQFSNESNSQWTFAYFPDFSLPPQFIPIPSGPGERLLRSMLDQSRRDEWIDKPGCTEQCSTATSAEEYATFLNSYRICLQIDGTLNATGEFSLRMDFRDQNRSYFSKLEVVLQ